MKGLRQRPPDKKLPWNTQVQRCIDDLLRHNPRPAVKSYQRNRLEKLRQLAEVENLAGSEAEFQLLKGCDTSSYQAENSGPMIDFDECDYIPSSMEALR